MFKPNQFIRWTNRDDNGKFVLIGRVTECTEQQVSFTLSGSGAVLTVPLDDGKFAGARKPEDWQEPIVVEQPIIKRESKPPVETVQRKPKATKAGGTKQDKAVDIYRAMKQDDVSDDEIRKAIETQLGMTVAGARTYLYNARKRVQAEK